MALAAGLEWSQGARDRLCGWLKLHRSHFALMIRFDGLPPRRAWIASNRSRQKNGRSDGDYKSFLLFFFSSLLFFSAYGFSLVGACPCRDSKKPTRTSATAAQKNLMKRGCYNVLFFCFSSQSSLRSLRRY